MVKASPSDIPRQLTKLDTKYRAVLVYGPDEGLVRERADLLSGQIVDDLGDPFGVARLAPEDIAGDTALLCDELSSLSMMGGRRLIRVDGASDRIAPALAIALELQAETENVVIVSAGELAKRSKLRKIFEGAGNGLALACYNDEASSLKPLILSVANAGGLTVAPDAMIFLISRLGGDRMASRQELEKLVTYIGDREDREISLKDAEASVGDSSALAIDSIAEAVASGELARLDRLVERALGRGENEIRLIRSLQRRLERLHLAKGFVEDGISPDQAMAKLKPQVFFKDKDAFRRQMSLWSQGHLLHALSLAREAEKDCKTTGMPSKAVFSRACLRIASAVAGRQKNR